MSNYNDFDSLEAQMQRDMEERRRLAELEVLGLPTKAPVAEPGVEYAEPTRPDHNSNKPWESSSQKKPQKSYTQFIEKTIYTVGGLGILYLIIISVNAIFQSYS